MRIMVATRKLVGPREAASRRDDSRHSPKLRLVSTYWDSMPTACHNDVPHDIVDSQSPAPPRTLAAKVVMERVPLGGPVANQEQSAKLPAPAGLVVEVYTFRQEKPDGVMLHSASSYRRRMTGRRSARSNRHRAKAFFRRVAEEWV